MSDFPPVRLGILSTARIAGSFVKGLGGSESLTIEAVASRDAGRAASFAGEHGIPRHFGSYEALLADSALEAIYVPLPNHLHASWVIRAAEAGKHVLCEKPLALSGAEAHAMFRAAHTHRVFLVEGYPWLSQPAALRLRKLLAQGSIGRVQMISAQFGFAIVDPTGAPLADATNIRLDPAKGGGALLDAGSYPMSLCRVVAGERPTRALAVSHQTQSGVDQTTAAILEFPSHAVASIGCSLATAFHRHALILGEKGAIETGFPNHAPPSGTITLGIKRGTPAGIPFEKEEIPAFDGFRAEAESFARMVRLGEAAWNGASEAESIDVALSLEAIARSAREGRWVEIGG